jgi:Mobilization protein NikA
LETRILTPPPGFREKLSENGLVEPNLSSSSEDSGRARNTRQVIAIRLAEGEREQIAAAARLQGLPLSSYLRCAALEASAVAVGRATVAPGPHPPRPPRRERPAGKREVPVLDWAPAKTPHYVDGELVRG